MRMFHMADLHIGKKLNQVSLLEDQQYMLDQTIALINQQRPDVLLLAGDIYDRRNPSVEAVQLLDAFFIPGGAGVPCSGAGHQRQS